MDLRSRLASVYGAFGSSGAASAISGASLGSGQYYDLSSGLYQTIFRRDLSPEVSGYQDLAPLTAAKNYGVRAMTERNELAEKFAAESQSFGAQAIKQQQYASDFNARLAQMNQRMGDIRANAAGAASQASSQREYSMLAKQSMEGTRRYLQELEAFRMPESQAIDFSFKDPLTGETLDVNTKFDDVYSGGFNARETARSSIMSRFERIRDRQKEEALGALYEEFGRPEDYNAESIAAMQASGNLTQSQQRYLEQYSRSLGAEQFATDFAEASAIAKLSGTENLSVQGRGLNKPLEYDASVMFYQQDINKLLDDMVDATTERMKIDRLDDENFAREEFGRRQQLAQTQFALYNQQQARNQAEAQRIEAEKQRVRQQVSEQEASYRQTMSSFGTSGQDSSGGINFTDTRPQ